MKPRFTQKFIENLEGVETLFFDMFVKIVNQSYFCADQYSTDKPDYRLKRYRVFCTIELKTTKMNIIFSKTKPGEISSKVFHVENTRDQNKDCVKIVITKENFNVFEKNLDELIKIIRFVHDNELNNYLSKSVP